MYSSALCVWPLHGFLEQSEPHWIKKDYSYVSREVILFFFLWKTLNSSAHGRTTLLRVAHVDQLVLIMLFSRNIATTPPYRPFHTSRNICEMKSTGYPGKVVRLWHTAALCCADLPLELSSLPVAWSIFFTVSPVCPTRCPASAEIPSMCWFLTHCCRQLTLIQKQASSPTSLAPTSFSPPSRVKVAASYFLLENCLVGLYYSRLSLIWVTAPSAPSLKTISG